MALLAYSPECVEEGWTTKFAVASSAGPLGVRDLDRGNVHSEPVLCTRQATLVTRICGKRL